MALDVLDGLFDVVFVGRVAQPHVEHLGSSGDLRIDRDRARVHIESADVAPVEVAPRDLDVSCGRLTESRLEVGSHEPVLETVKVLPLHELGVVLETHHLSVVVDSDQERATVGVEEGGDGLGDRILDLGLLLAGVVVPAGRRLELDGVALAGSEELRD